MKCIIFLIVLILFSGLVFAEDYSVGQGLNDGIVLTDSTDNIETARLRSDIAVLNNKIDSQNEVISKLLKTSDVIKYKDEFFLYQEKMLNYFLSQLLLMLGVVIVFFFTLTFVFKAKKWL